ncbi:FmdB family zinc ribbon protein [Desulfolucanica intricata]|uniref:FmdB family zinc ribbon protein n=1 Tax=Desulfolucanica intricata TaxID=1285191 RepID=UPI000835218E|nr:zinc ribbon domain-containing protein [Desulfolucanica intricata]
MPIYDYLCEICGHKFTVLIPISAKDKVSCPECKATKVKQLFTGFSVTTGGCSSPTRSSSGGG